ncbi:MAG: FMN-binding negative transcriptional regulator [Acidobacteria bacterium]|nr:FMN-binding negative transcriptional regulator [Acidobacteriota bacterium]
MTRFDDALADDEWQQTLRQQPFGQLIAVGPDRLPMVVPAHFRYDDAGFIELHLRRDNPILPLLMEEPKAMFTTLDAHVYIPSTWNGEAGLPSEWRAPTSYYASVQITGKVEVIGDPDGIAQILQRQIAQMQPEGGYGMIATGSSPYGRMLAAIRGVRLDIEHVRSKFKFGGNKSDEYADAIAARLLERGGEGDARAREHLLRRRG